MTETETDTDLARMDDDGFNSKHLHRRAKKRFVRAATAYCSDVIDLVPIPRRVRLNVELHKAMIGAYEELLRT